MKRSLTLRAAVALLISCYFAFPVQAQPPAFGQATVADGPLYAVTGVEMGYAKALPFLPDIATDLAPGLGDVEIDLGKVASGYVAPREGIERETIEFRTIVLTGAEDEAGEPRAQLLLHLSALNAITDALTAAVKERRGLEFFIVADPNDVDPDTGQDLRGRGDKMLSLVLSYDGPFYPVSRFELSYAGQLHPSLPAVEEILDTVEVGLVPTPRGYVPWRPGVEPAAVPLGDLTGETITMFSAGAIQVVLEGIRDYMTDRGYMAIHVVPAEEELDPDEGLADLRGDRTEFRLSMITGVVSEIRTLALGKRVPMEDRINHPVHNFIKEDSPFQVTVAEGEEPANLLRRDELDNYLFRLSRHPGRRVDAAIAPAEEPLSVALDYLVTENKPLLLYAQASNTGTAQTDRMRYRFGLYHNQLTGNDDILGLEFISADFDGNNAALGSYSAKFLDSDTLRWRVYGGWSEFVASEVGFADEEFTGESFSLGGELAWNFYQDKQLFLDLIGGARFMDIEVNNAFVFVYGEEDFFLPYIGVRAERYTEEANTIALLMLEWSMPDVTSVDEVELNRLGRLSPDDDWFTLKWDAEQSFYLEPLLNREAWQDLSDPDSSTLAHEVALRCRGQYAFDYRLIPQMEQVAGGLYSVRGYPESIAVGDTVVIGTA
ncbi:MAG: hypothetical protein JSV91_13415, partial [Phycisphaerales bacterium]